MEGIFERPGRIASEPTNLLYFVASLCPGSVRRKLDETIGMGNERKCRTTRVKVRKRKSKNEKEERTDRSEERKVKKMDVGFDFLETCPGPDRRRFVIMPKSVSFLSYILALK